MTQAVVRTRVQVVQVQVVQVQVVQVVQEQVVQAQAQVAQTQVQVQVQAAQAQVHSLPHLPGEEVEGQVPWCDEATHAQRLVHRVVDGI